MILGIIVTVVGLLGVYAYGTSIINGIKYRMWVKKLKKEGLI